MSSKSISNQAKHKARQRALQALYQWDLNSQDYSSKDILTQFTQHQDMRKVDVEYFEELVNEITKLSNEIDELLTPHINISLDQLDPIERNILRLAIYELKNKIEIPYRVVINEGVELTKAFGADQAHKFVNGVLDKASKQLRALEINS